MHLDEKLIETLLHSGESAVHEYKSKQYPFANAAANEKAELLKDMLAFANAWKTSDAYILIGIENGHGKRGIVHGVTEHIDDASLQQFVNGKTNTDVAFTYVPAVVDGKQVAFIRFAKDQRRPIYLKERFVFLNKHDVYVRRSSSTDIALPEEIYRMGVADAQTLKQPQISVALGDVENRQPVGSVLTLKPKVASPRTDSHSALLALQQPAVARLIEQQRRALSGEGSPEAAKSYKRNAALHKAFAFVISNVGSVLVQGTRIVVELRDVDTVQVRERRPPLSAGEELRASLGPGPAVEIVERTGFKEVTWYVGKIQPGAVAWSDPLWLASANEVTLFETATVFTDELEPLKFEFEIRLEPTEAWDDEL